VWGLRDSSDWITWIGDILALGDYCAKCMAWSPKPEPISEEAQADFDALEEKLATKSVNDIPSPVDLGKLDELTAEIKSLIERWKQGRKRAKLPYGYYLFYDKPCLYLGHKTLNGARENMDLPGTKDARVRGRIREFMIKVKNHKPPKAAPAKTKRCTVSHEQAWVDAQEKAGIAWKPADCMAGK
jgi:hypothetical protein